MIAAFIVVAVIMALGFNTATGAILKGNAVAIIAFECIFTAAFARSWGPLCWLVSHQVLSSRFFILIFLLVCGPSNCELTCCS